LELVVEPEKLVAVDLPIRPPTELNADKESVQALGGIDPPTAGAGVVKRFTAQAITQWREQLTELGYLPEGTPDGWSKCRVDPAKMLTVFPELRVRQGYVLRAYVFKEDANANGFVCALPADADFPEPDDCPRLESHFLTPPKPLDALDDIMEVIEGDDSPESYLHASILRRELREFGGGWHGIQWGMNTVLDASPWESVPTVGDEPATDRPTSKPHDWKWRSPQPETWSPEVRMDQNQVVVTFYSYTRQIPPLGRGKEAC
jgi:hypothetical protein